MRPWEPGTALSGAEYSAVELAHDGAEAYLLDQLRLPSDETYRSCATAEQMACAIRDMVVRGAPAIGIAAAYGMVLAGHGARACRADGYREQMEAEAARLIATRPTAVNLKWAVDRCLALVRSHAEQDGVTRHAELAELARSIHRDDVASCRALGHCGASILRQHARDGRIRLLTHCNAGALATGGYGTALGVVRACVELGLNVQIFADETRPYLQGARLTAWELVRDGIDVTVIADDMAAHCMQRGLIDAVVVGADRIAANGDVANKIGTYGVACLAHAHAIPFYVAAPMSTIDERTECGSEIPIEERARAELCELGGRVLVPSEARVLNPGFDVTPARLIKAIFTERGVMTPPIGP